MVARDRRTQKVLDNLHAAISGAVRDLSLEVTANLTQDSPVDTGHFRRNWVPSVAAPYDGEDEGAAQAAGTAALLSYQIGDGDVYVGNNVPYGMFLVLGSSSQAPLGWDLQAVDRAVATVQQRYDGLRIDVSPSVSVAERAGAAGGIAAAYSPFGDEG